MKKYTIFIWVIISILVACNTANDSEKQINKDSENSQVKEPVNENQSSEKQEIEKPDKPENIKSLMLNDEKLVFSFKTKKGKTMNIVLQKDGKYMAYRFGTENNVELQFPEKLENTFEQFTYTYYFRGGGAMNMGLDLNYLSFKGDTHKFVIFDEWSAGENENEEESKSVGIKIIDLATKKEVVIEGIYSTVKGSLIDFRDNGLVKVEEGQL